MLTVSILLDSVEKVQRFVSKISRYSCSFDVESGNSFVDGKSLVGLLVLISADRFSLLLMVEKAKLRMF